MGLILTTMAVSYLFGFWFGYGLSKRKFDAAMRVWTEEIVKRYRAALFSGKEFIDGQK